MSSRLLSEIVDLTPTAFEAWRRCVRSFLLGQLLALPASDPPPSAHEGLLVHELLRLIHEHGSVHDRDHVEDVLAAHGADNDHYRALVARHARRAPAEHERAAHEVSVARFHHLPAPMYMATARIDAVWIHDGLLDARDYKTGGLYFERVADDARARVQAWILAAYAIRRGLKLRLRYEFLAAEVADDPEPWEPEPDEIEAMESELTATVADLWNRAKTDEWPGVADPEVCSRCRFRSICADSAAPGEPTWPAVSALGGEEPGP